MSTVIPAPKRPQTLPVVLSPDEVVQFLDCVKIPMHRTILTTCVAGERWCEEEAPNTSYPLSTLRLPLSIHGSVEGRVQVRLHNSRGVSAPMSFPRP